LIYHQRLDGIVECISDLFQVAHEPTPGVLKAEARIVSVYRAQAISMS
jgi:hypothetical protein